MRLISVSSALLLILVISNAGAVTNVAVASDKASAIEVADQYMNDTLYTIIHKRATPPNGDSKNNYMSMAPYWWPTGESEDGLPYENRDGEYNPESRTDYTDFATMRSMKLAVCALCDAYRFTCNDRYVERVKEIITTFFIAPQTRMLPNLNYAQFVPGVSDGSCFGIIETVLFEELLDAVNYIRGSSVWDEQTALAFDTWFRDYLIWLTMSELGVREQSRLNNHGTHYDGQCLAILIYLGKSREAANYLRRYTIPRLEGQVSKDGSQQREIARTKSWNYSMMNLKGWIKLADYADRVGVDLWHYERDGQTYIKSMIDWFLPYLRLEKRWKWRQIIDGDIDGMRPVLERAAEIYGDDEYLRVSRALQPIPETRIK